MAQSRFYAEAVTTLEESIVPGDYLQKGKPYRKTTVDAGWPIIVRQDLSEAFDDREKTRKALVSFVQITDLHIIDASSPGHAACLKKATMLIGIRNRQQVGINPICGSGHSAFLKLTGF